jgi:hypothetical protein
MDKEAKVNQHLFDEINSLIGQIKCKGVKCGGCAFDDSQFCPLTMELLDAVVHPSS